MSRNPKGRRIVEQPHQRLKGNWARSEAAEILVFASFNPQVDVTLPSSPRWRGFVPAFARSYVRCTRNGWRSAGLSGPPSSAPQSPAAGARQAVAAISAASLKTLSIADQLAHRQKWNLTEIQYRLLQLVQLLVWCGGILLILNLYPQTRIISFLLIAALRIPYRIGMVALIVYFLIRLTYFLIAKLSAAAINSQSEDLKINQRGKLRINTTTRILRSAVAIIWMVVGILAAFWVNGVNLAPLLTGAGIFGLGLSLASQNLIKDAINGFIIIWDDRYAVGDIVDIGTVSGLVENINLRITQLRDAEGRLITVPNSAVEIVANRSSQWSRADLNIPVAYQTDIDRASSIIHQVAEEITQDATWQERIWEFPNILGVEHFSDRGILIRVWIKTEPLKQWEVAREFRRRVKIAFDQAGIPIPIPQQQILLDKKRIVSSQSEFGVSN